RELSRGLRADPSKRHASMEQLLAALERGGTHRRTRWLLAALGATLALAAVVVATRPRKAGPRQSVAVVGPGDLEPRPQTAFISGALGELLATEMEADPQLRLISARSVAPALADLGQPHGAQLDAALAQRLQRRLGAQLVLGGSYQVAQGQLRVRVSLWG